MHKRTNARFVIKAVSVLILTLLFSGSFFFDTAGPPRAYAADNTFTDNIGIGITAPAEKLQVIGNIAVSGSAGNDIRLYSAGDTNWRVGESNNPGFTRSLVTSYSSFLTYAQGANEGFALGVNGGNSSLEILGSDHRAYFRGNVGIGTTGPSGKLDVAGNVKIGSSGVLTFTTSSAYNALDMNNNGITGVHAITIADTGNNEGYMFPSNGGISVYTTGQGGYNAFVFDTVAGYPFVFNSGNVGIGTTGPLAGLAIGTGTINNASQSNSLYVTGNLEVDGSTYLGDAVSDSLVVTGTLTATNASMTLKKLTVTEDAYLATSSGNVGIGTAVPGSKLDVRGNTILFGGNAYGDSAVSVYGTNGNNDAVFTAAKQDGTTNPSFSILPWDSNVLLSAGIYYTNNVWTANSDDTNSLILNLDPGTGVGWYADDDTTFDWDVANNVILWDTTANWKSTIQSTRSGTSYITGGNVGIGTTNPIRLLTINRATEGDFLMTTTGDNSRHVLKTDSSANALIRTGNSVDLRLGVNEDAITIKNGGNVGIGTTAPLTKLQVYGNTVLGDIDGAILGTTAEVSRDTVDGATTFGIVNSGDVWFKFTADNLKLILDSSVIPQVMTWQNTGNVGIGTTAPLAGLAIGTGTINNASQSNSLYVTGNLEVDGNTYLGDAVSDSLTVTGTLTATNASMTLKKLTVTEDTYLATTSGKNVGIGTASPLYKIDINDGDLRMGDAYGESRIYFYDTNAYIYYPSNGRLTLTGYSGVVLAPDAQQNVGIGTAVPDTKLHVDGDIKIGSGTDNYAQIERPAGSGMTNFRFDSDNFRIFAGGTGGIGEIMRFKEGGNVGIGTTNPQQLLTLSASDNPILRFDRQGANYDWEVYSISGGSLRFRGGADGVGSGLTDFVTFNSTGNVGIGTTGPGQKLDVNGSINLPTSGSIKFNNDTLVSRTGTYAIFGTTLGTEGVQLKSGNATAVTINTSGNVGIGTVGPQSKLQVKTFAIETANEWGNLGENIYYDGTWKRIDATKEGAGIHMRGPTGSGGEEFRFRTVTSAGTFNNIAGIGSVTSYINSGNVGIGTTSPASALEVRGTIQATADSTANRRVIDLLHDGTTAILRSSYWGSNTYTPLTFHVGGGEKVRIDTAGNVGIGTTGPLAGLAIGTGTINNASQSNSLYVTGNLEVDGSTYLGDAVSDSLVVTGTLTATNASMTLKKLTVTEDAYLATSSGNVGIGTAIPTGKLQVIGTGTIGGATFNNGWVQVGTSSGGIAIDSNEIYSSGDNLYLGTLGANDIRFRYGGTDNVAIKSDGKVGLGGELSPASILSVKGGVSVGETTDYSQKAAPTGGMIVKGSVGIGTTSPAQKLQVAGNVDVSGLGNYYGLNNRNDLGLFGDGNYGLSLQAPEGISINIDSNGNGTNTPFSIRENATGPAGGNALLTVLENGNVGIGTAGPNYKFELSGTSYMGGTHFIAGETILNSSNRISLRNSANNAETWLDNNGVTGESLFSVFTNSAERLTIKHDGNVGIGTTNPLAKLDVTSTAVDTVTSSRVMGKNSSINPTVGQWGAAFYAANTDTTVNNYTGILFANAYPAWTSGIVGINKGHDASSNRTGELSFQTFNAGTVGERIRINSTGNVGIGTTAPSHLLTVYGGNILLTGAQGGAQNGLMFKRGGAPPLTVDGDSVSWIARQLNGSTAGNSEAFVFNQANGEYRFKTAGVDWMVVDGNRNVGIGTTAPLAGLAIGTGTINNASQSNSLYVTGNLEVDGSTYLGDAVSDSLTVTGTLTATSATMTLQKLTVNQDTYLAKDSGSVGIGTASPGAKLEVNLAGTSDGTIGVKVVDDNRARIQFQTTAAGAQYSYLQFIGATNDFEVGHRNDDGKFYFNPTINTGHTGAALVIQENGNVGIGTAGPTAPLNLANGPMQITGKGTPSGGAGIEIEGDSSFGEILSYNRGTTSYLPLLLRGSNIQFENSGTEAMRITSGNVGIGTTGPQSLLHVYSTGTSNQKLIQLGNQGTADGFGDIFEVYTNTGNTTKVRARNSLAIYASQTNLDDTPRFFIKASDGNVGIGTTGPSEKLHLAGGTFRIDGTTNGLRMFKDGSASISSHLYLANAANNRAYNFQLNADGSGLDLWTYAGSWANKVSFLASGNVGIGTADPGASKLRVQGDANITGTLTVGTFSPSSLSVPGYAYLATSSGNVGIGTAVTASKLHLSDGHLLVNEEDPAIYLNDETDNDDTVNSEWAMRALDEDFEILEPEDGNKVHFRIVDAGNISFLPDGVERLTIKPDGNVGIGTTAINNRLQIASDNTAQALQFNTSSYAPSNQWGTRMYKSDIGGGIPLILETQQATTWYESARFDHGLDNQHPSFQTYGRTFLAASNGSVGIGTTVPGEKLDVVDGNIRTNRQFVSTVTTGTAPLSVLSTTVVPNLNADKLDGSDASAFMASGTDNWVNVSGDTMQGEFNTTAGGTAGINMRDSQLLLRSSGDYNHKIWYYDGIAFGTNRTHGNFRFYGEDSVSRNGVGGAALLLDMDTTTGAEYFDWRSGQLRIDFNGNVGIGTASIGGYSEKFRVHKSGLNTVFTDGTRAVGVWTYSGTDPYVGLGTRSAHDLLLIAGDSTKAVITTGGRVGIGTTNPGEELEVSGDIHAFGATGIVGAGTGLYLGPSTNSRDIHFFRAGAGALGIGRYNGGWFESMRINSNGNVGIGTTNPSFKLSLSGTNANLAGPHVAAYTTADAYPVFQQLNYSHDNVSLNFDSYYDGTWRSADAGSNFQIYKINDLLQFLYSSGTAAGSAVTWNTGLVLNTSGSVGIGTTDPQTKLKIETTGSTNANLAVAAAGTGDAYMYLDASNGDLNGGDYVAIWQDNTNLDAHIKVGQSGAVRDLILQEDGGNVGIGTTGPGYKLSLYDGQFDFSASSPTNAFINRVYGIRFNWENSQSYGRTWQHGIFSTSNAGSGSDSLRIGTYNDLDISLDDNNNNATSYFRIGHHAVANASLGTPLFVVQSPSGNVGIGTADPGAYKLYVNGPAYMGGVTIGSGVISFSGDLNMNSKRVYNIGTVNSGFDAAGNLGIGVANPAYDLEIAGSASSRPQLSLNGYSSGDSGNTDIYLGDGGTTKWSLTHRPSDQGSDFVLWRNNGGWTREITVDYGTGNVGIGTTSPGSYKLYVAGSIGLDGVGGIYNWANGTNIVRDNSIVSGGLGLQYNNISEIIVTDNVYMPGNVGIGTTAPGAKLDVAGAITADGGLDLDTTGRIRFIVSSLRNALIKDGSNNLQVGDSGEWNGITFQPGASEAMRIAASGNVGIGTTNPASKLEVDQTTGDVALFLSSLAANDNPIRFRTNQSNSSIGLVLDNSSTNKAAGMRIQPTGELTFNTGLVSGGTLTNATEKVRIDNNGNVGIGTAGPITLLDMGASNSGNTNTAIMRNPATAANSYSRILVGHGAGGAGSGAAWFGMSRAGGNEWNMGVTDASLLEFAYNANPGGAGTKMVIKSDGNVGIGTTNPGYKLDIAHSDANAGLRVWRSDSSGNSLIRFSSGTTATDQWSIGHNTGLGDYFEIKSVPSNAWRMVIKGSDGNVGIGTTSPGNYKLNVNGNTNIAGTMTVSSTLSASNFSGSSSGTNTGDQTDISGYAGTLIREDNRIISPSELTAGRLKFGFTSWANDNSSPYADFLHLRSYTDSSGGADNLLMFKKSGIGMRLWQQTYGSATAYATYKDVAFAGDPWTGLVQSTAAGTSYITGGSVGIGTAGPATKLHVFNASSGGTPDGSAFLTIESNSTARLQFLSANTAIEGLAFGDPQSNVAGQFLYDHAQDMFQTYIGGAVKLKYSAGAFAFQEATNISTTAGNLNLMPAGNVGIGTTGPAAPLTIRNDTARIYLEAASNPSAYYTTITNNYSADSPFDITNSLNGLLLEVDGNAPVAGQNTARLRGANALALRVGTTDRLYVNSNGNVGIGTTNPTNARFEVAAAAGYDAYIGNIIIDGQGVYTGSGAPLFLGTNGQTQLTVSTGGNLGIGTSPVNKLDVEGGAVIGVTYSGANTAPTNGLLVEGNVGIGTADTGAYKLYVNGNAYMGGVTIGSGVISFSGDLNMNNSLITNIGNANTDFTSGGGLNLASTLTMKSGAQIGMNNAADASQGFLQGVTVGSNNTIQIQNTGGTPTMTVDTTNARVGIGTTAPGVKLHVSAGNILLDNNQALQWKDATGTVRDVLNMLTDSTVNLSSTVTNLSLQYGVNQNISFWGGGYGHDKVLSLSTTSAAAGNTTRDSPKIDFISRYWNGSTSLDRDAYFYHRMVNTTPSDQFVFTIGGGDRMVVGSDGNVGIGTTGPGAKLEVSQSLGNIGLKVTGESQFVGTNNTSHFNYSTGENTYIRGGKSNSLVYVNDNSSGHIIMATGGGNVGIGTADTGAYKLYVNGNAYMGGVTVANGTISFSGDLNMNNSLITNIGNANTDFTSGGGLNLAGNLLVSGGTITIGDETISDNGPYISLGDWAKTADNSGFYTTTNMFMDLDTASTRWSVRDPSNAEKFTVTSNGNVGIGTTSPTQKLELVGNILIQDGNYLTGSGRNVRLVGGNTSDDTSYEWVGFYSGTNRQGIILYDGAWTGANNMTNEFSITAENNNHLTLNTGSGYHVLLMPKGAGNVGIGTTAPQKQLHIAQANNDPIQISRLTTSEGAPAAGTGISWTWNSSGTQAETWAAIRAILPGSSNSHLTFSTRNTSSVFSEKMRIKDDGNVGIGTTSPAAGLEIEDIGQTNLLLLNADNDNPYSIRIKNKTNSRDFGMFLDTAGILKMYKPGTANFLVFNTESGNVGIGTADTGAYKLYVNGDAYMGGVTVANGTISFSGDLNMNSKRVYNIGTANSGFDVTGNLGIGTNAPGTYKLNVQGTTNFGNWVQWQNGIGTITWDAALSAFNVNAGSGRALSFGSNGINDRMILASNGNVGIGTTKPGQTLEVVGNVAWTGGNSSHTGTGAAVTTYVGNSSVNNALIRSNDNSNDAWVMNWGDSAAWGIYNRNIDSTLVVGGAIDVPANSTAFIGSGLAKAYIAHGSGDAGFSGTVTWSGGTSTNANTAYSERRQWDGGSTNLVAATGRTSLGLGSLATSSAVSGGAGGTITDSTITNADLASGSFTNITGVGALSSLDVNGALQVGGGNLDIMSTAADNFNIRTNTNTPNPNFAIGIGNGAGGWSHTPVFWNNYLDLNGSGVAPGAGGTTSHIRILSDGNVGIGTTVPSGRLHVLNTDGSRMIYSTTGNISTYDPEAFTGEVRLGAAWDDPGVYSAGNLFLSSGSTSYNIYLTTGDSVAGTGANTRMTILGSNGSVGIGTASPASLLDLGNSGGRKLLIYGNSATAMNTQGFGVDLGGNSYSSSWWFPDGSPSGSGRAEILSWNGTTYTPRLVVKADGNVGIGTTNPGARLQLLTSSGSPAALRLADTAVAHGMTSYLPTDVYGSITSVTTDGGLGVEGASDAAGSVGLRLRGVIGVTDPTDTTPAVLIIGAKSGGAVNAALGALETAIGFDADNNLTPDMVMMGNGYVGIGTAAPSGKLHVRQGNIVFSETYGLENDSWSAVSIKHTNASSQGWVYSANPSTTAGGHIFKVWDGSGYNEKMRIAGTGNVGIGTGAPVQKLHVDGNAGSAATSGTSQNGLFRIRTVNNPLIDFGIQSSPGWAGWIQATNSASLAANYSLLLNPNGGNVGIGTTAPNAMLNIYEPNESATQTNFTQAAADAGVLVSFDMTDGTFTPGIFWSTDNNNPTRPKAGIYLKQSNSAGTTMYFGTSNTYATGITNNAMVIDPSGYVGIGTTAPGARLQVGNGTDGHLSGTEDAFIKGSLEIDATAYFDGPVSGADNISTSGNINSTKTTGVNRFDSNVGIKVAPTNIFQIAQGAGNALADGWTTYSSREFKKDINALTNDEYTNILSQLNSIDIVRYRLKKDSENSGLRIGVIAEDAPAELRDGEKSVNLGESLFFLMAAVKAQQKEITELKDEIGRLKQK